MGKSKILFLFICKLDLRIAGELGMVGIYRSEICDSLHKQLAIRLKKYDYHMSRSKIKLESKHNEVSQTYRRHRC